MLRRWHFNLWYFLRPPWDRGISPPELFEFMEHHAPGRAIDLGCGTGTNVITLAQHGWQVTGVDFAPRAIQMAKKKIKQAGVRANVMVGDVTELNGIDGPFDLALDMGCFHGVPDRPAYLRQLLRVLAPGGYWLVYTMFRSGPERRPGLTDDDLKLIGNTDLRLLQRMDGVDRHDRPSAWFLYQRPPHPGG